MYKQAQSMYWTADEIDLGTDYVHWKDKLSENERQFLEHVLAFFSNVDVVIVENISHNFLERSEELGLPIESTMFYCWQIFNESIHAQTYALMIDALVKDEKKRDYLFNAVTESTSISNTAKWIKENVVAEGGTDKVGLAERLIGMACVEGVMFSAAFCAIFWLRKRGLMDGVVFANDLISRDEGLHMLFACESYKTLCKRLPDSTVENIVRSATEHEESFVDECLPLNLIGINAESMKEYVRFCSDRLLVELGHNKLFNSENPFDWMEMQSIQGKENFFEKRVSNYRVPLESSDANAMDWSKALG